MDWAERQGVVFAPNVNPHAVVAALWRTRARIAECLADQEGCRGASREQFINGVMEAPAAIYLPNGRMLPADWAQFGRDAVTVHNALATIDSNDTK